MARLEIDVVAKGESTIGKVTSSLGSLQKKYEEAVFDVKQLSSESQQLESALKSLKSQFEASAISESKFNAESARLSKELTSVRGAIQTAQNSAVSLKSTIDQTANSTRSFGNETKKLQAYSNDFTSGIRSANTVAVEFSRIIQDAPYGIQGVANNIQQLTQNWAYYTRAAKEAAAAQGQTITTGGLLRGALSSMLSPVNLLTLAISAVTAGWIAYENWSRKAEKATKETEDQIQSMVKALNNVSTALYNASTASGAELAQLRLLYQVSIDVSKSTEDRRAAAQQLINKYPELFGKMSTERVMLGQAKEAYDRLSTSILATARAQAAYGRIGEKASEQLAIDETNNELRRQKEINEAIIRQNQEKANQIYEDIRLGKVRGRDQIEVLTATADALSRSIAQNDEISSINKQITDNLINRAKIQEDIIDLEGIVINNQSKIITNTKKATQEYDKLGKAIEESTNRVSVSDKEGREKEIQQIENWYKSRLELAKGNANALVTLQDNMRAEIDAVNTKWDAKELEDGRKMMEERQKRLAEQGKENVEQIKKDAIAETQMTINYQRRLFESKAQTLIRELNNETKIRENAIEETRQREIKSGEDIQKANAKALQERIKLQEDYYKRIEELTAKQRELDIVTSFDGSATSMQIASISAQVKELSLAYENGAIPQDAFINKMSDLSVQREQLGLLQSSIDGVSGAFGSLFSDAIFDSENALENLGKAFESLAKTAVSELAKIGIRQALNLAVAKAGMASSLAAAKATSAALTATWSTPATLASIATLGGAALTGSGAILTAIGAVKGFSLAGFSKGGYTGNGGVNDIAGFVHGKEYVINAKATKDNLPLLKAINNGMDISGLLKGTGVSASVNHVKAVRSQRVDVVVHGEISGDTIKLANDMGNRSFNRYFG